jgi:hypothetical protein
MDKDYDTLAEKVAEYIGVVQPQLDELENLRKSAAERKAGFAKKATEALTLLADEGLMSRNDVSAWVDKSAEDPSSVWDLVTKVASAVKPSDIGHRSDEKTASATPRDPWEREFGGYSNNSADNGMID